MKQTTTKKDQGRPYTTARTIHHRQHVVAWDAHVERLVQASLTLGIVSPVAHDKTRLDARLRQHVGAYLEALRQQQQQQQTNNQRESSSTRQDNPKEINIKITLSNQDLDRDLVDRDLGVVDRDLLQVAIQHEDIRTFPDAVHCILGGTQRKDPTTKTTLWKVQRQELEQKQRQKGKHETLLRGNGTDAPKNSIVEGLETNVFAVTHDGLLQTAGQDLVLPGTMRKLVLQAADEILNDSTLAQNVGLTGVVATRPPTLTDDPNNDNNNSSSNNNNCAWRELFLTSTSRIVLPILSLTDENDTLVWEQPQGQGRVGKLIKERVMEMLSASATGP